MLQTKRWPHQEDTILHADFIPLGAAAFVVASDAPLVTRQTALLLKPRMGNLIQLCDGVADNVQMQAANDAVPSSGGTVLLLGPTFNNTGLVTLKNQIAFRGDNRLCKINAGGAQTVILTAADGSDLISVENLHLHGSSQATLISILGATSGASRWILRDLQMSGVPSGKYAIDIEWLISSHFENLYINGVANGIRWQNLRAASSGGNSVVNNILVNLLAATAGIGLSFGSASASYATLQSIVGSRLQVNGDSTAGQKGLTVINGGSSVWTECDLELLDYGISLLDSARFNIVHGGYIGNAVTRGVTIDATSWKNKISGPMRIGGVNTVGSVGVEDLSTVANTLNVLEDVDIYNFPTLYTSAGKTRLRNVSDGSTANTSENSGTATLLNGQTSVVFAHSLMATPTHVTISWKENPTNAIGDWWWTADSTNITLNGVDPGASNLDFSWEAHV